jgi:hypothetical protein
MVLGRAQLKWRFPTSNLPLGDSPASYLSHGKFSQAQVIEHRTVYDLASLSKLGFAIFLQIVSLDDRLSMRLLLTSASRFKLGRRNAGHQVYTLIHL